jgi:hypothetical protein
LNDRGHPLATYEGDAGYPSLADEVLGRRAFLGRALAGAAAAVGALAGTGARATPRGESRTPSARRRLRVSLDGTDTLPGSSYRFSALDVFSSDPALGRFLAAENEAGRLTEIALPPLRQAVAATLYDGRKIYRLERQVGDLLARHYRTKTRRTAPSLDVMLHIVQDSGTALGGVIGTPVRSHHP